jgi:hypothetical protein
MHQQQHQHAQPQSNASTTSSATARPAVTSKDLLDALGFHIRLGGSDLLNNAFRQYRDVLREEKSSLTVDVQVEFEPQAVAALLKVNTRLEEENQILRQRNATLQTETARVGNYAQRIYEAYVKTENEIQQTLGRALGYPRYCDDQSNFPFSLPSDGVCVGSHCSVTLADEAAATIDALAGDMVRQAIRDSVQVAADEFFNAPPPTDMFVIELGSLVPASDSLPHQQV